MTFLRDLSLIRGVMPKPGLMSAKVMLVEDNDLLLDVLRVALEREGYEVIPVASGGEMMKMLESTRPDLIVLDIALPDADGRDILATLKKNARMADIPVVVWSGRYADSDRAVVLGLGAEDYVEKGPPASVLVPKIERVLFRISERQLAAARV